MVYHALLFHLFIQGPGGDSGDPGEKGFPGQPGAPGGVIIDDVSCFTSFSKIYVYASTIKKYIF